MHNNHDQPVAYRQMLPTDDESSDRREFQDTGQMDKDKNNEKILGIEDELELLKEREKVLNQRFDDLRDLWQSRITPIQEEMNDLQDLRLQKLAALEMIRNPPDDGPVAPGPACLNFINGSAAQCVCSTVIFLNLIVMCAEFSDQEHAARFWTTDQFFLSFYLVEISIKAILHQRDLLIGDIKVVWWNWLDSTIVLSGILDQWMLPMLKAFGFFKTHGGLGVKTSGLRVLRLLRLFRIMRVLRIVKIFMKTNLSWTERPLFQTLMICVIVVNALTMSLELDYPQYKGFWYWAEQTMLIIYFFELSVRLKRWGWHFFVHPEDFTWNNLDFTIVSGGVLEQWMMPTFSLMQELVTGEPAPKKNESFRTAVQLLRMLRLLRVLRLIRLVRSIKPLYRLLFGIVAALQGIQWVLLLAVIMLYAAAIVFTSLVGHGVVFGEGKHFGDEEVTNFASVPESMFMLFKLMNDDQSVVEGVIDSIPVKLMFCIFMICSNWIMLAILTAVVSDNMISATQHSEKEDDKQNDITCRERQRRRLFNVLHEADEDDDGEIDESEFKALLDDADLCGEICDASGLQRADLEDLFLFVSTDQAEKRSLHYVDFVDCVQDEGKGVSERSVFRLEKRVRVMERTLKRKLDVIVSNTSSTTAAAPASGRRQVSMNSLESEGRRAAMSDDEPPSPAHALDSIRRKRAAQCPLTSTHLDGIIGSRSGSPGRRDGQTAEGHENDFGMVRVPSQDPRRVPVSPPNAKSRSKSPASQASAESPNLPTSGAPRSPPLDKAVFNW